MPSPSQEWPRLEGVQVPLGRSGRRPPRPQAWTTPRPSVAALGRDGERRLRFCRRAAAVRPESTLWRPGSPRGGRGTPAQVAVSAAVDDTNCLQGGAESSGCLSSCVYPQRAVLQRSPTGLPLHQEDSETARLPELATATEVFSSFRKRERKLFLVEGENDFSTVLSVQCGDGGPGGLFWALLLPGLRPIKGVWTESDFGPRFNLTVESP